MKQGSYTKKLKADRVICSLCPHQCLLSPDCSGFCKVRENVKGKVDVLNYLKLVEEKEMDIADVIPDFLPETKTYAIRFSGTNLYPLEEDVDGRKTNPEFIVKRAIKQGCKSITFLGEPGMAFESVVDVAKQAKSQRLKTIVVTRGYLQEKPFLDLMKHVHAIKLVLPTVDREAFAQEGGKIHFLIKNIELGAKSAIHFVVESKAEHDLKSIAEVLSIHKKLMWNITGDVNEEQQAFLSTYKHAVFNGASSAQ